MRLCSSLPRWCPSSSADEPPAEDVRIDGLAPETLDACAEPVGHPDSIALLIPLVELHRQVPDVCGQRAHGAAPIQHARAASDPHSGRGIGTVSGSCGAEGKGAQRIVHVPLHHGGVAAQPLEGGPAERSGADDVHARVQ